MSDNHIMNTDHWLQYYNHNLAGQMTAASNVTSSADATIVSTAAAAGTNSPGMNASGYGAAAAANPNLNPDGRVTKPARRRSRASRRTPTTLLNTDTTNFRAMVQQYTGGPSASFPSAAGFSIGGPAGFNVGHGAGLHQQHHSMIANQLGMGAPAGTNYREGDHGSGGFRLQFQQPAQYMFGGGNNNVRPNMMELASEDQIGMEGLGSAYGAGRAPPPPHGDSSSGENKSRNSFLF